MHGASILVMAAPAIAQRQRRLWVALARRLRTRLSVVSAPRRCAV